MRDRHAVIWTRALGAPAKLADMVLTDTELRVAKTERAIADGVPGISLLHDSGKQPQFVHRRGEGRPLPPQLEALLPPPDFMNPQRRILSSLLARRIDVRGMHPVEQQWHLLVFAGRNGIGHIDVFANDEDAAIYYARRGSLAARPATGSALWLALRKYISDTASDDEAQFVEEAVGPTPGVSGFFPKLLAPIEVDGDGQWNGNLFGAGAIEVVAKMERDIYPGALALEDLAFDYHRRCGFDVPRTWYTVVEHNGETVPLLAVERFDRQGGVTVPQESFYSLLATGSPAKFGYNTDGTMELAAKVFDVLRLPMGMREEWFGRFVMSFLTGNGDLHSENMAIIGNAGDCRLSPLFDPAPMRAYRGMPNHDLLSALAFAGIGGVTHETYRDYSSCGDTPPDLGARLVTFGKDIGIAHKRAREWVMELCLATAGYGEEAIARLESIPMAARKRRAPDIDGFNATLKAVRTSIDASVPAPKRRQARKGI